MKRPIKTAGFRFNKKVDLNQNNEFELPHEKPNFNSLFSASMVSMSSITEEDSSKSIIDNNHFDIDDSPFELCQEKKITHEKMPEPD